MGGEKLKSEGYSDGGLGRSAVKIASAVRSTDSRAALQCHALSHKWGGIHIELITIGFTCGGRHVEPQSSIAGSMRIVDRPILERR